VDPQGVGLGAGVAQRGLSRLLHHLTQLAGELQRALARHDRHLDAQGVSACLGPCQAGGHANGVGVLGGTEVIARRAEVLDQGLAADALGRRLALGHAACHLAADVGNLAVQVAHARLVGVLADDTQNGGVGEAQGVQPVLLQLVRDEEAARDVQLLILHVAGELDHLHAVFQRGRDRVQGVGRSDEHHLRQVERHLQVVVGEGVVLFGVEPACQSRPA